MKKTIIKKIILLTIILPIVAFSQDRNNANNSAFLFGIGALYKQQIYKGFDQRSIIIPVIGYKGKKLDIYGPFVSYELLNKNQWELDANLSPRFDGIEPEDSEFFQGLNKREDSFDAGFSLRYKPKNWEYELKYSQDILSKSNGNETGLKIAKSWRKKSFSIAPFISMNYLDPKLVDYYYGVSQMEISTNRNSYNGKSSLNHTLGVNITKPILKGLLNIELSQTRYGSGITDSPLVEDDNAFQLRFVFVGQYSHASK